MTYSELHDTVAKWIDAASICESMRGVAVVDVPRLSDRDAVIALAGARGCTTSYIQLARGHRVVVRGLSL